VTYALIAKVAAHLIAGGTLSTHRHVVGPHRGAFDGLGEARFACAAHSGMLIDAWEAWDEAESPREDDRRGNLAAFVPQRRRDWSAFGAARAFVSVSNPNEVEKAIRISKERALLDACAPPSRRRIVIDVQRYNRRARWGAQ
jgi:hypothetical protein